MVGINEIAPCVVEMACEKEMVCEKEIVCEKEMACCVRGYHIYKDT